LTIHSRATSCNAKKNWTTCIPRGTIQKLATSSKFIHSVALVAEARATRRASHERFEKKKKFDTSNYIHNWYKQKDLLFVYKLVFTFLNTCF
jgi:hypothetical protein